MSYNTKPIGYKSYPVETNFPTWEKWFRTLTIQPQNWTDDYFAHPSHLFNWQHQTLK